MSSRGFTAGPTVGMPPGITVFLDGIRQNEADAQEVNFDLLPLDAVDHVELLSGTASLLGPNSLGGAISLVTVRGDGPPHGEVQTSAGSFGAYRAQGEAGGRTNDGWDYYASGETGVDRGRRAATGDREYNVFTNFGRDGDARGVRFQILSSRSRAETAGSLPEALFHLTPSANFTPGDFEDLEAQQASVSGYAPIAHGQATFTVYGRRSTAERFNVNQAPDPNVRGFTTNLSFGGTADERWTASVGPGTLAIRIGVDGAVSRVRVRLYDEAQMAVGLASGNVSDVSAASDSSDLTTDVESPSPNVAGYALADYRVGRATLSGGMRGDYVRTPFHNMLNPANDAVSTYTHLSPRVGASVDLGGGLLGYASAGGSFRAPAILELSCADPSAACPLPFALGDDPPLAPVVARTYEIGVRWIRSSALLSASVYRTDVRDEIFFVASEHALLSGYFTNLDRTRRDGVEIAANGTGAAGRLDSMATRFTASARGSTREVGRFRRRSTMSSTHAVQHSERSMRIVRRMRWNASSHRLVPAAFPCRCGDGSEGAIAKISHRVDDRKRSLGGEQGLCPRSTETLRGRCGNRSARHALALRS